MKQADVKKAKTWSFVDGAFWTGMVSFGEVLTMLYLAKVVTDNTVLAMFSTLPMAIGAVAQVGFPHIFQKISSRNMLMSSIFVQITGLSVVAFSLSQSELEPVSVFFGMVMYWAGGMMAGPPWQDMMSKLIPVESHNRYFAGRSALLSIVNLCTNLCVGLFLHERLNQNTVAIFVTFALFFRVLSLGAIWMHPKPLENGDSQKVPEQQSNSQVGPALASEFALRPRLGSLAGLAVFLFFFRFGANLSGPFFNPYMLNHLHFSVMSILVLSSIPLVTRIFLMSNWGTILDRAWALEGVAICGLGISVLPAMWTLSNSFWWIVGLQVWSGHVWAGFEVLSVLLVQRMFPHVIVRALAVTFAAGTAGSAIGGLVGGQLLEWGLSIPQLFRVSSIVRFSAVLSLLMYLRMQGAFRFRTLRIPESARELLSLQPTKRAARSLRTTMSWLLLGRQ
jgi:MFS family permease